MVNIAVNTMKRLSKNKLIELGFTHESWSQWWNGYVFVVFYPKDIVMTVYVCAQITSGEDYARPAIGVKTESDLIKLCQLINGVS